IEQSPRRSFSASRRRSSRRRGVWGWRPDRLPSWRRAKVAASNASAGYHEREPGERRGEEKLPGKWHKRNDNASKSQAGCRHPGSPRLLDALRDRQDNAVTRTSCLILREAIDVFRKMGISAAPALESGLSAKASSRFLALMALGELGNKVEIPLEPLRDMLAD